jgi:glycosyltransferase involved in cell wall biosynthesis
MRVLTFTSLFPNSIQPWHGSFVCQRVAALARRPGNFVEVVSPVPYAPAWIPAQKWKAASRVPDQEMIEGLSVFHPRYFLLPKISMVFHGLLMFAGSAPLVKRLHAQKEFQCIDAHYVYPDGFAAVLLGKTLRIPVVVSARGTDISLFPSFKLIRPMIQWTLRQSIGVAGVCEALKDAMVELGASPDTAQAIGNGIDIDRFTPVDRREARRRLKIAEGAKVVVSVGSLVPVKGHQFLIPALALAAQRHPSLRLYVVGEGILGRKLEEQAQAEGIGDRVFFVGRKPNEELKDWYSAADVSCLASSREGWANVLLESLACGTPVVATRVWGTPEVLNSADLGVLVEQDVESIAQGLELALARQWDREALVRRATSRTWEVVARDVENFLSTRVAAAPLLRAGEKRTRLQPDSSTLR